MTREYKVLSLTAVEAQPRSLAETLNVQAADGWKLAQALQDARGASYGLDLILVREPDTLARIERMLERLVALKQLA